MKWLLILAALIALGFVGLAIAMRFVQMPAETWHVEPSEVTAPGNDAFVLLTGDGAPRVPGTLAEVAAALQAIAMAEGAERIAGDLTQGHATFVARSRVFAFPDAISIRLRQDGDAVVVEVFSRARFGYSDLGVNAARIERWLTDLTS